MSQPKRFFITTPIYYVNAEPHIGNAYTTVAADILNRYNHLFGYESYFLTGTDEHGSKVADSAEKKGLKPQEFCDINSQKFKDSWQRLDIRYDKFIRTTDPEHEAVVRKFIQRLYDKGYIYQGEYSGLYCTGCEKFLTEKELDSEGCCPNHLTKPRVLKERNYFFKLSGFLEPLKRMIESDQLRIVPEMRKNEVLGLFKQNLDDFSLSRERVRWGISLPFDDSQVTYVWVDALINYISALDYPDGSDFQKFWNEGMVIHLMAKDILKFHCIFWPALLMAADVKLPDLIVIHGYLILDSMKISKTLGNIIKPEDMIEWFGVDASRYLNLNMCTFGSDGEIRIDDFYTKYNADLANNYGNLVSRTFKIVEANLGGKLPRKNWSETPSIVAAGYQMMEDVKRRLAEVQIKAATDEIIAFLNQLNGYFDENKPWILARENRHEELGQILYNIINGIALASAMLSPYLVEKSAIVIRAILGEAATAQDVISHARQGLTFKEKLNFPKTQLFPRKEPPKEATPKLEVQAEDNLLSIEEFSKAHLQVAEVKEAEKVVGADKLLRLQIEIGSERRQIVAGVAQFYRPDQLIGKKIIVVTNLKPAKVRGIESNGMLLAAKKNEQLTLVTVDADIPSGAKIS